MAVTPFSKSKFVNPQELASFSDRLDKTITQLQSSLPITVQKRSSQTVTLEQWPLLHHVTSGVYFQYKKQGKLWIGLDLVEEGIALIIWVDEPTATIIQHFFNLQNTSHCGEFGRYKRGKLDQVWIALAESDFDKLLANPTSDTQIIGDFLRDVLW